jgi:glutamate synthase (NADPH/NADH) large chain
MAMNRSAASRTPARAAKSPDRFKPLPDGEPERSAIKQVASGRFGVTTEYLVNADMIQIKIAQGAKPGEGGQLPGHKVDADRQGAPLDAGRWPDLAAAAPRHLLDRGSGAADHDLKNANPKADISVKLVSEVGVGTVAAGVSKARADHVTISGYDGGTGASPLTSIKHAGSPWEIGLAETHQTLVLNGLRGASPCRSTAACAPAATCRRRAARRRRVRLCHRAADRAGCIMMRKCHLNTCPVGVATQDPVLRKRFTGKPEHVINYFFFVAEEVREMMAAMGFRTINEIIGQHRLARQGKRDRTLEGPRAGFLRLIFCQARGFQGREIHHWTERRITDRFDPRPHPDREGRSRRSKTEAGQHRPPDPNVDRSAGAMLSGEVASVTAHAGLPDDTISIKLRGTAGQSFGAFVAKGVTST